MKFIDFFAGIGGFRRGLELAGHECVGFCEYDKFAVASYTSMHLITDEKRKYLSTLDLKERQKEILKEEYRNGEWYSSDIRTVNAGNVPGADIWCFGAPCQDFSVAGARKGLKGDRSSLVREVFRIISEIEEDNRPEWLIYENVKGMLSSNAGWDFFSILCEMDELGYDCEWQLFNSKDYGVPQNRERVYTVGHLRRRGSSKIFPIERTDGEDNIYGVRQIGSMKSNSRKNPNPYRVYDTEGISPCLCRIDGGGREPHIIAPQIINMNKSWKHEQDIVYDSNGIMGAISARDYKDPWRVAIPVLTPDRAEKHQNGRRFKEDGDEAFTLTGQDRHGVAVEVLPEGYEDEAKTGFAVARGWRDVVNLTAPGSKTRRGRVGVDMANTLDTGCNQGIFVRISPDLTVYAVWYPKKQCYIAVRKLTPKECFRLQGWSDDYFEKAQFVNSNSQLYKQAGNGVTVNVVYEIGKALNKESEDNINETD